METNIYFDRLAKAFLVKIAGLLSRAKHLLNITFLCPKKATQDMYYSKKITNNVQIRLLL